MRNRLNKGPPTTPTLSTPDRSQPSSLASHDLVMPLNNELFSKPGTSANQQHSIMHSKDRDSTDGEDVNNKLFKKQDVLMRQLYQRVATIEYTLDTSDCSKEYLQLKVGQLQKCMDEIDQLHTQIMVETNEDEQTTTYFKNNVFGNLQDKVEATIIKLQQSQRETPTTKGYPKIKLPTLDIPNFSGEYENWSSFNDIFTELIHQNNNISDTVKMSYLKSHLQKGAAQLISHLSTTGENYEMAWGLLQSRYNNRRLLAAKYFNVLLSLPTMQVASAGALRNLHDSAKEMLHNIERLNMSSSFESFVTFILIKKMDPESIRIYETTLSNPREIPNISEYFNFMERRFQSLEAMGSAKSTTMRTAVVAPAMPPIKRIHTTTIGSKCWVNSCKQHHGLAQCEHFRKMSTLDRARLVNGCNICRHCLLQHKKGAQCRSSLCIVCNGQHHTLLHCNNAASSSKSTSQTLLVNQQGPVLLPTAIIKTTTRTGRDITLRALIDSGSQATLISAKAANLLNTPKRKTYVSIAGIGGNNAGICNHFTSINLKSRFAENFSIKIDALIFDKLAQQLPESNIDISNWKHLEQLQLADPYYNQSQPIDLVIGADYYPLIILDNIVKGKPHEPMAQNTEFGWIIIGNLGSNQCQTATTMVTTKAIQEQLELLIENDNIPEERNLTEEELKMEEFFQENLGRNPDGRFTVRIPFKSSHCTLGESRKMAVARLLQLERKFHKNGSFKQMYHRFMQEYIDLGHMDLIHDEAENVEVNQSYYIPHHGVIKEDSTTTKLRVVFDASAKTTTGISLNDLMMTGPKIQQDLADILLRWRRHKYILTADIEKMYRQVWMHEKDRDFQRILWRDDPAKPMNTYRLNTVTYGTTPASFLAIRALKQLAQDGSSTYPTASKILSSDFYVDDLLTGSDDLKEAALIVKELRGLMEAGGMNLRKWTSNSVDILKRIPSELHHKGDVQIKLNDSVKTLGILYHPAMDTFEFDVSRVQLSPSQPTKRSLLSDSSKLFDPIGWLSPITITAKLMMQEAWTSGIAWDDWLPTTLNTRWMKYKEEMSTMKQLSIPRWIGTTKNSAIELHGFSDASELAYAAVIYCRTIDHMGHITTHLLTSKTRVAPIKTKLSIPRLELNAALLLAKLMKHVQGAMELNNIKTHAWTDSTITLCWIKGDPNRFKTFIANRISAIRSMLPSTIWHHVRSTENPADIATRGTTPLALTNCNLWWKGPDFLHHELVLDNYGSTPNNMCVDALPMELKEAFSKVNMIGVGKVNPLLQLFERHSNFNKLKRIVAYCKRFINNKTLTPRNSGVPSNREIEDAETTIIKIIQEQDFYHEIQCLNSSRQLDRKSKLLSLNPMLDNNKILRVNGRLRNSNLTSASRNPIILDKDNIITVRIIEDAHYSTLHGGTHLTLAYLRNKYWIIDGKRAIRKVIHKCIKCFRHKQHMSEQLMGSLPAARVIPGRAFAKTGIDYAGPIQLRTTKGRGHRAYKGYIALFVCMVTKAIHIEIVSCLTTESFIAAYKRFVSRRGLCTDIFSDNGTYFVGANAVLKNNHHTTMTTLPTDIATMVANDGTNWHFIPPHTPHFGGIWEAGIKSLKFHLKRVIGESTLTFEELYTVTTQIEACLNSRPLRPLTNDVSDLEVLTPGHFLIGDSLKAPPWVDTETISLKTRWHMTERLVQNFWKIWSSEYIHQLQQRTKWTRTQPNLGLNDMVLLKDDQLPPTRWKLGRVLETHAGKDNLVRVATVKCQDATYRRPITKLCRLPIEDDPNKLLPPLPAKPSGKASAHNNAPTRQQPHRQAKQPGTIPRMALAMFSMCCILGFAQATLQISPFNNSNGIYFEELGKLEIVATKWTLIVHYNLTSYWEEISNFQRAHTEMRSVCKEISGFKCDIILQQLLSQYNYFIADNELLFESNKDRKRIKRGLGDSMGLVLGDLFGVLTQREADKYETYFEKINNDENYLLSLIKNQTTIVDNTINLVKHNTNLTTTSVNNLIRDQHQLKKEMLQLQEQRTKEDRVISLLSSILEMMLVLNSLQDTQQGLLDVLHHAHQDVLHPSILTPSQLEDELQFIRQHVPVTITLPGHNIHDLHHVYESMQIRSRVTQNNVIIEITLPLSFVWDYTLMSVVSIPNINHGSTQSRIIGSTDYIAMDNRREHFALLTKEDVNQCQVFKPLHLLCEVSQIINTPANQTSCEVAILQRKGELDTVCSTTSTRSSNHWIKLQTTNQWIYVIPNELTVDVICGSESQSYNIAGSGIVEIQAGCVLRDTDVQIIAPGTVKHNINKSYHHTTQFMHDAKNLREFGNFIKNKVNEDQQVGLLTTPDTTQLDKQIESLKADEDFTFHHQAGHHVHHYAMIHILFWSAVIVAVIWVVTKIRQKHTTNHRSPPSLPRPEEYIV